MNIFLGILQTLDRFDHWLFQKINTQWTNSSFDLVLPFIREQNFWMPLYLFVFLFVALNFKRNWWWWIILFLCTVALTDMTGTHFFKNVFLRPRPCDDPIFAPSVRLLLKDCATSYSFISNHAANHFGLAAFFFFTLKNYLGRWTWITWLWAFAISYAQVYVGIHFPLDVMAGTAVGILFGFAMAMFFNKKFGFANFDRQPTVAR
jgi:undecaprenyl-diphosphatase